MWDVVDLGTKKAGAIKEFRKNGAVFFKDITPIDPAKCLGIDLKDEYESDVTQQGIAFKAYDLATDKALAELPTSKYYLAWHFLEHVPNKDWSNKIVKACLDNATKGCWFRLPSFQPDEENGEGALRKHGLRFCWSNWHGHPTHYLVEDCRGAIEEWLAANKSHGGLKWRSAKVFQKPAGYIKSTTDKRVVFIDSPCDTTDHHPEMGKKPAVNFSPPIVSEWEVAVKF